MNSGSAFKIYPAPPETPFGVFSKRILLEHFLQKSNRQKPETVFFLDFVLSRFWALLGEGSKKTPLKKPKKSTNKFRLWRFFDLFYPVVFWRPLERQAL
jgi:hypothetical protein